MIDVDMSPSVIERRLVMCAELSASHPGPLPRVDMSARAVEARLAECDEMSALCLALAKQVVT